MRGPRCSRQNNAQKYERILSWTCTAEDLVLFSFTLCIVFRSLLARLDTWYHSTSEYRQLGHDRFRRSTEATTL